ncbi:Protein of unknown function [Bacillus cytotoxicus]|uniref:ABC transmembrane type-1 domain-containing protein n=1 Tax=Bacillus cytotoxicus TaxID=580165 RepID=A0AAX2CLX8_9BACI|nr:Protein of unknown function [Bacillus cytotoxicus]
MISLVLSVEPLSKTIISSAKYFILSIHLAIHLSSFLVESLNGISTVKSYNAEKEVFFQTERRFVNLLKHVFKRGLLSNLQGSIKMGIELIGGTVILWIGAMQVLQGNMTIGELITYNALLAYFLNPIENLIGIQPVMHSALVAGERLNEIFDLDIEKNEREQHKASPNQISGKIEFSNVTFRYGVRKNVLNKLNFSIKPGNQVAFVGGKWFRENNNLKIINALL